jgi:hypothetical protein
MLPTFLTRLSSKKKKKKRKEEKGKKRGQWEGSEMKEILVFSYFALNSFVKADLTKSARPCCNRRFVLYLFLTTGRLS